MKLTSLEFTEFLTLNGIDNAKELSRRLFQSDFIDTDSLLAIRLLVKLKKIDVTHIEDYIEFCEGNKLLTTETCNYGHLILGENSSKLGSNYTLGGGLIPKHRDVLIYEYCKSNGLKLDYFSIYNRDKCNVYTLTRDLSKYGEYTFLINHTIHKTLFSKLLCDKFGKPLFSDITLRLYFDVNTNLFEFDIDKFYFSHEFYYSLFMDWVLQNEAPMSLNQIENLFNLIIVNKGYKDIAKLTTLCCCNGIDLSPYLSLNLSINQFYFIMNSLLKEIKSHKIDLPLLDYVKELYSFKKEDIEEMLNL